MFGKFLIFKTTFVINAIKDKLTLKLLQTFFNDYKFIAKVSSSKLNTC